jgi:hypothetical protein
MGSITRGLSNNITTGGVILPAGITNSSVSAVTSFANASGGTLVLLSTQTASDTYRISFTSGLDSTYDAYEFHFINIRPRSDGDDFTFQTSTNGGSSYGVTTTTTSFYAFHNEADSATSLSYDTSRDLAQSTGEQILGVAGSDADQSSSGILTLFNPSSTTYVKHFIANFNDYYFSDYSINRYTAGYFNTTSAINAIRFGQSGGNFDGIIKLYGLKKS